MRPLLIAFGVMSLISLAVYGADKARAQTRRRGAIQMQYAAISSPAIFPPPSG